MTATLLASDHVIEFGSELPLRIDFCDVSPINEAEMSEIVLRVWEHFDCEYWPHTRDSSHRAAYLFSPEGFKDSADELRGLIAGIAGLRRPARINDLEDLADRALNALAAQDESADSWSRRLAADVADAKD